MHRRDLASLSALALTLAGCPEEPSRPSGGTAATAITAAPPVASVEKPAAAPQGSEAPKATAQAAAPAAPEGKGIIKGVVKFTGKPVEMKVPTARKDAPFCQDKDVLYNAVVANDGKLKDTFVRIAVGGVPGSWKAPDAHAVVDQQDCMYVPRIQGVVSEQQVDIKNSDRTLHNVHTFLGSETVFNEATAMGTPPITKRLPPGGIVRFGCDIHPWMRAFVIVTDHPFFGVSGDDGVFRIERVPAGKYRLEAWHARYGLKTEEITVTEGQTSEVSFSYDGAEPEPPENQGELKDLW